MVHKTEDNRVHKTMEYYSAVKKTGTNHWNNMEHVTGTTEHMDESQRQTLCWVKEATSNITNYLIPFIWKSAKGKSIGTEDRSLARDQGWEEVWVQQKE